MVEEVKTIQTTEIPDWLRKYQDEILTRAQALAQDPGFVLPQYQVAERTPMQQAAAQRSAEGVGSYIPMLQAGAGTVGQGVGGIQSGMEMTQEALMGATPYQEAALGAMQDAIPGTYAGALEAQDAARLSAGNILGQAVYGQQFTDQGAMGLGDLATRSAQLGTDALSTLPAYGERMEAQGQDIARAIAAASGGAQEGTAASQRALAEAGKMGVGAAQAGIAGLAGAADRFTPDQISTFMNQYEDTAVQQALADIARAGEIQKQSIGAQAVGAEAYGGARQAIAEQELGRNILEQQGRTAAGMRQAGYESAAKRAQAAYESALGRQLQQSQLTGALGQAGAGSAMQAATGAAQLGQAQAGQMMQGAQQAGAAQQQGTQAGAATAQAATQMGLAGLGQAGQQTGLAAQTGLAGAQLGTQAAGQAGQMGIQAGQAGMQAAQQAAGIGQNIGQLGAQYGQLGLSGAGQMGQMGQGLGSLGMQQARLGEAYQGLNINDINLLSSMGAQEQAQQQAILDAQRQTQYQNVMSPYQQLGFYSDIYQGMPTAQSTFMTQQSPSPNPFTQAAGIGLGLYGMSR